MSIPDWMTSEDWDVLYLAGKRMPGVAHVSASMASGIDTKKPRGGKKARQRDIGAPPAKLKCELELTSDELDAFERDCVPLLRPRNVFAPRDPIDISHPQARLWGINVVICGEIDSPHPNSGGTMTVSFTVEEWAPDATDVKKGADKPKDDGASDWDVQKLIDALRPAKSGAAERNFSEPGFPGSLPGDSS